MWAKIVEGKPQTRLLVFIVICLIQIASLPLVKIFPPLHAVLVLVCLFFFISFVI